MPIDTLKSMSVFRHIVERGSMAAAARTLGISPEMAGHHLRSLEERLGVRLVNRTTRSLHVTEAGRAYYRRCVNILDEVTLADAEAGQRQAIPTGSIRIAAPLAFANTLLHEPIAAFSERYPGVSLDLDLSERSVNIIEEGFDIAIRLGELQDSRLVARRLIAYPLIPVASKAYLTRGTPIGAPSDLAGREVLVYSQTNNPRLWRFKDSNGSAAEVSIDGKIAASDIEFLLKLALGGSGILLAPSFIVEPHLVSGRLTRVLGDWTTREIPLNLLFPHRTYAPAAVTTFLDFIADWFHQ